MEIRELSRDECLHVLAEERLARLACAHENQPYVVPVYLAYDPACECFYGFTTPGQKVEWMRTNPRVCVEVDKITAYDQWVSVIASGRYEELTGTPGSDDAHLRAQERPRNVGEATPPWSADSRSLQGVDEVCADERERAWRILKTLPEWCGPGIAAWVVRTHRGPAESYLPVYYRIRIDGVSGYEAIRDARDAITSALPAPPRGGWGWLGRKLARAFGGKSRQAGSAS
jgi:nitroimidazol reductase NimA-like FMN-containing flavoprotein (pyridoxamine 5'-phosphate oxidase superfamily)